MAENEVIYDSQCEQWVWMKGTDHWSRWKGIMGQVNIADNIKCKIL